mmetsp:Transcript_10230/g.26393  ORF Transcript_10230/g.26393 Transcript_10230/m.26393 type:complete len:478 (-) Transcript_10230:107-1540(-)
MSMLMQIAALAVAFGRAGAANEESCEFVRPPMGWNSYDSSAGSGTGTNESTALAAAEFVAKNLRSAGYEFIVLDAGWFGPYDGSSMALDEYGRLVPDITRHPSSAGGVGFRYLSDVVHGLGLKFGFWIMGGIPRDAVKRRSPIENTNHTADEAADLTDKRVCSWQPGFVYGSRLNPDGSLHPAAIAYYDSIARLYKTWGVDFIKMDCVFGNDYYRGKQDMEQFSSSMNAIGQEYLLSLSPGSDSGMASIARSFAETQHQGQPTMARMTSDFWDSWTSLYGHFETAARVANFTGSQFFPDLDMLPLGWVSPYEEQARYSKLTLAEARSLMTLMVMARAPLIWGGAASEERANATTVGLLSNTEVLGVARSSCLNRQLRRDSDDVAIWAAQGQSPQDKFLAFVNLGENVTSAEVDLSDPGIPGAALPWPSKAGRYVARDLWLGSDFPVTGGKVVARLLPHSALLLRIRPAPGAIELLVA